MKVSQAIGKFKNSSRQTKYFIFMLALYTIALIWTTLQAYARLEYSRSDEPKPIKVRIQTPDHTP